MAQNKINAPTPPPPSRSRFLTIGDNTRSFLGWALAISLVAHLLLGPLIPYNKNSVEDQQTEKVTMTKKTKIKVPTPPPPTPPPPTPNPKDTPPPKKTLQHPQPKLKVEPPVLSKTGGANSQAAYVPAKSGNEQGVPAGVGTPQPGPGTPAPVAAATQTPKPVCAHPQMDARTVTPVTPELPDRAKEAGFTQGIALVRVSLSASGGVLSASINKSSGNSAADQAAIAAAKEATFAAAVVDCKSTAGDYLYRVEFGGD